MKLGDTERLDEIYGRVPLAEVFSVNRCVPAASLDQLREVLEWAAQTQASAEQMQQQIDYVMTKLKHPSPLWKLVDGWYAQVRKRFAAAKHESDPMGKRLMEHGAVNLYNCAEELRRSIEAGDAS